MSTARCRRGPSDPRSRARGRLLPIKGVPCIARLGSGSWPWGMHKRGYARCPQVQQSKLGGLQTTRGRADSAEQPRPAEAGAQQDQTRNGLRGAKCEPRQSSDERTVLDWTGRSLLLLMRWGDDMEREGQMAIIMKRSYRCRTPAAIAASFFCHFFASSSAGDDGRTSLRGRSR